jgi:molybdopterin synthase catalytic subunit
MVTKENVEAFLKQFHQKLKVFSIIFRDDRGKNVQTLAELEITPKYRELVIRDIKAEDYSQGPIVDTLHQLGDMWVFGKDVKGHEVYIKISLGRENSQIICISFHISEYKMKYPLKGDKQ